MPEDTFLNFIAGTSGYVGTSLHLSPSSINGDYTGIISSTINKTNSFLTMDITVSIHETEKEDFSVYPNPLMAGQGLNLEFEDRSERNISLVDISGKVILERKTKAISERINLPASLSKETYFIRIIRDDISSIKKILVN